MNPLHPGDTRDHHPRSPRQRAGGRPSRWAAKKCGCSTRWGAPPRSGSSHRSRSRTFANSAMDGFAVAGAELEAGRRQFRVVVDIPAGRYVADAIGPGEAARIMTGAPLPSGRRHRGPGRAHDGGRRRRDRRDAAGHRRQRAPRRRGRHRRRRPLRAAARSSAPPRSACSPPSAWSACAWRAARAWPSWPPGASSSPRGQPLATGPDPQLQLVHRLRPGGRRRRRPDPARASPATTRTRRAGSWPRRSRTTSSSPRAACPWVTTTSSSRSRTSSAWSDASGASPPSRASRWPSAPAAPRWSSGCPATRSPPW